MIGFNGTYLAAASLGEYRITDAAIGGQWVMLGTWLMPATQQAIIAAFGAEEGIAVISKTNDYLNAIAATDTARAQQLSAFINEDPLLVCSLVETSKTRWLVGDGKAYIKTDIWGTKNMTTEVTACNAIWRSEQEAFTGNDGSKDGTTSQASYCGYIALRYNNTVQGLTPTHYIRQIFTDYSSTHTYKTDKDNLYIDGKSVGTKTSLIYDSGGWLQVFKHATMQALQCYISKVIFTTDSEHHLLPYNNGTESGMLDIISFTFYPNANTQGSFTIALTDKQPTQ